MKVNLVAPVCCMVVCMATICAGSVPIVPCKCVHWSPTRVQVTKLRSYTVQKAGPCGISAIRFETELGKGICSNPDSDWAKNAMKYLDDTAKPAKATTTPIPVTTPRKGGPSPTPIPVTTPRKRGPSLTNPTTKSPVQDRGTTSSLPTTPTTMTTHQETQTTRRPVHRDTSPLITRKPIKHNTKRYTPSPITRTPTNHNTKRYTPSPITRTPTNHNTKRYISTVITRKPINHNTKGYTTTVITRKPINHNTKGYTSTVRKIITVLPTRKLPSWIKRRENRKKKPGLRRKQRVNYLRPHK